MGMMIMYITSPIIGISVTIMPAVFAVRVIKNMVWTVTVIGIIIITAVPPGTVIVPVVVIGVIAVITPKFPVTKESPFPIANLTFRYNHRILFVKRISFYNGSIACFWRSLGFTRVYRITLLKRLKLRVATS